jgi:hypothetical protein
VISRNAAFISSLTRQKPVSSAAVIVPEKARVNNETLTITVLFTSFSLNEGPPDCNMIFSEELAIDCNFRPPLKTLVPAGQ